MAPRSERSVAAARSAPPDPGALDDAVAADVERLVAEMTLDEKAAFSSGADMFDVHRVQRLGIGGWRMTDGPNGVRGVNMLGAGHQDAWCIPCGSALGATWDRRLIAELGRALGEQARAKDCRVLLAPTVNLHRSPLAGRNFECMSEDPWLTGQLAAEYVAGVQSEGVVAMIKHFVGNEAETDRRFSDSIIDEVTLRETYLLPFEFGVRLGGALGVMAAYNKLNGIYCTERDDLLGTILRDEWGFDGFVSTDWSGITSTVASHRAGVDIEMPGPSRSFGPALAAAVRAGDIDEASVDRSVSRLIATFARMDALDDAPGDDDRHSLRSDRFDDLARRAALGSIVLLQNPTAPMCTDRLLPVGLDVERWAVVGPAANRTQLMGGGSAALVAQREVSVLDALAAGLRNVDIRHEPGCPIGPDAPMIDPGRLDDGFDVEIRGRDGHSERWNQSLSRFSFGHRGAEREMADSLQARIVATFTARFAGPHRFELIQAGRATLAVDGDVVIDGAATPPPTGKALLGHGSEPMSATVELDAGERVELIVEFSAETSTTIRGCSLGCREPWSDEAFDAAIAAAGDSDVAVVVVGTDEDTEGEGFDRTDLALPGRQDELIRAVAAVNPRTVVVVNTGGAAEMPWADLPVAVVQAWFGGQAMAEAIVDVLTGASDPGGRLPFTVPNSLADNPTVGNFPGNDRVVAYDEGTDIGHRWYERRSLDVRFPFGHGLSYGTAQVAAELVDGPHVATARPGPLRADTVPVVSFEVSLRNTGGVDTTQVVQCYVERPSDRGAVVLRDFESVVLGVGASAIRRMEFDARALARWQPGVGWMVDPGRYEIRLGRSVDRVDASFSVDIEVDEPNVSEASP